MGHIGGSLLQSQAKISIVDTISSAELVGPIVVVIDALDNSGDKKTWKNLLLAITFTVCHGFNDKSSGTRHSQQLSEKHRSCASMRLKASHPAISCDNMRDVRSQSRLARCNCLIRVSIVSSYGP